VRRLLGNTRSGRTTEVVESSEPPIVILQLVADLTKTVSREPVQPGDEFDYTITANCSSLTEACVDATLVDVVGLLTCDAVAVAVES
jgi:hypothetical protein